MFYFLRVIKLKKKIYEMNCYRILYEIILLIFIRIDYSKMVNVNI